MPKITSRIKDFGDMVHTEAMAWGLQTGKNIEFIDEALACLTELKVLINKHEFASIINTGEFFSGDRGGPILTRLEKIFSNRFGFNLKIIRRMKLAYNAFAKNPGTNFETLLGETKKTFDLNKNIDQYIKKFLDKNKLKPENLSAAEYESYAISKEMCKVGEELTKRIKKGLIKVDATNIKLINASDLTFYINADFAGYLNTKISDIEKNHEKTTLAIILHEIGHLFDFVHSLNAEFVENNIIYEEIQDIAKKNGTLKDVYRIVVKDEDGNLKGAENIDTKSEAMIVIKIIKGVIERNKKFGIFKLNRLNQEEKADNFAAAFHLAGYKAAYIQYSAGRGKLLFDNPKVIYLQTFSIFRIVILLGQISYSVFKLLTVFPKLQSVLFGVLDALQYNNPENKQYRNGLDRTLMNKKYLLSSLKKVDYKKEPELYKDLTAQLKLVDEAIAMYKDYSDGIANMTTGLIRIIFKFLSSGRSDEIYNLEIMMEDMINNDLYGGSAMLKETLL